MNFCLKILLTISFLLATTITFANNSKPFNDYQNKSYHEAFPALLILAKEGNTEAEGLVGRMYYFGLGTNKNISEAILWTSKSAESGYPLAQNLMGVIYRYGNGVEKDINKAIYWLLKSANQNFVLAQRNLGDIYLEEDSVSNNYESFKWFEMAANNGNAFSKFKIGLFYLNGIGISRNEKKGIEEISTAADLGSQEALNYLGELYRYGRFVDKNENQAKHLFEKSASLNNAEGQFYLAEMLLKENNKNYERIIDLISKSASAGNYLALLNLIDPPDGLLANIKNSKIILNDNTNIKLLANHYREKNPNLIKLGEVFNYSPLAEEVLFVSKNPIYQKIDFPNVNIVNNNLNNLLERQDLNLENILNTNSSSSIKARSYDKPIDNKIYIEEAFTKANTVLKKVNSKIQEYNSDKNNYELVDLLKVQKYLIFSRFDYADIDFRNYRSIKKKSSAKRLKELKEFSEYLITNYPKENILSSFGVDLLSDYYKSRVKSDRSKFIRALLEEQKSDEYLASLLATFSDEHLKNEDHICNTILSIALENINRATIYVDYENIQVSSNQNLDYLLKQAVSNRSCLQKNDNLLKTFYFHVSTLALHSDQIKVETLASKKLIGLSKNIEDEIIYRVEHSQALRRNHLFETANYEISSIISLLEDYRKRITNDTKLTRVSEWAKNPTYLLVSLYKDQDRIELAKNAIKRQIRIDLEGFNNYSESIVNYVLADSLSDLSDYLEKNNKSAFSIFLLKKAFEYKYIYDLEMKKNWGRIESDPNVFSFLNDDLLRTLISRLIAANRTLEAEIFLRILKKNELSAYLRDQNITEYVDFNKNFYIKDELLLNLFYKKNYNKIKQIYKKNYKPNYYNDTKLNSKNEKVIDEFIDFITQDKAEFKYVESKNINQESSNILLNNRNQNLIPNNTAHVTYILDKNSFFILINTRFKREVFNINVNLNDLTKKIYSFRSSLSSKKNVEIISLDLYRAIFLPIENFLLDNGISNIALSLDGNLRYVPFRALFNGKEYLVEKYNFNIHEDFYNVTYGSNRNINWNIAGFGTTKKFNNFSALTSVEDELKGIIKNPNGGLYPGSIFLNDSFTYDSFKNISNKNFSVIHVATHFQFSPGAELNSYLLLGNGTKLALSKINQINFKNVDLLTFSACQTALGGGKDENGKEIAGLAYLSLKSGANSVLASLWSVNDRSTAHLMKRMYEFRLKNSTSKSESLRMAQIDLLRSAEYSHPFYWGAFEIHGSGHN